MAIRVLKASLQATGALSKRRPKSPNSTGESARCGGLIYEREILHNRNRACTGSIAICAPHTQIGRAHAPSRVAVPQYGIASDSDGAISLISNADSVTPHPHASMEPHLDNQEPAYCPSLPIDTPKHGYRVSRLNGVYESCSTDKPSDRFYKTKQLD